MTIRLILRLLPILPLVAGCGGVETKTPTAAETKKAEEEKTLRKLDSTDEKEQVEGAREAAKQFGEPKKEDKK